MSQFRMPAEWEPHEATWVSWPRADQLSYPGNHWERARPEYLRMVRTLAESEPVFINVSSVDEERWLEENIGSSERGNLRFFPIETDEPWCRDHGPTFVLDGSGKRVALDWTYNAWGGKYKPYDRDAAAARSMADSVGIPVEHLAIVTEGGAIESNGAGQILTTASSLLNTNRNPHLEAGECEQIFRKWLGAETISWIAGEIPGDDTDSHIDTLTRFVTPDTIVSAVPVEGLDAILLPCPPSISCEGKPLPASYANFYIANQIVLVPGYGGPADDEAVAILAEHFPDREVRVLSSRELIFGLGSFHCLTQQLPAEEVGED